jgi:hypothetical protein
MGEIIKVTGKVHSIGKEQILSDKFKKREIVIEMTENNYKNHRVIQFTNERTGLLDNAKQGMEVSININLKGRLWTGNDGVEKCFNTDEGWSIEQVGAKPMQSTSEKMRHASGLNGEIAQDHFDQHMYGGDGDLF